MAMSGDDALALAKSYTKKSLAGAGALKGDKGDKGDTGPQGPRGPQGLQGEQGLPGINGADGSLGEVRVRTGKFAYNENSQRIYEQISPPIVNPLFSRDANNKIMCVSTDGIGWDIHVCEDISTGIWQTVKPQGVNQGIKSIEYSSKTNMYYLIGANGYVYFSEDYETWSFSTMTVSTENIDSVPERLINDNGNIYILCDTGELCYIDQRNNTYAESTGITHPGATNVFTLYACYIFQGNQEYSAAIYNGRNEIEKMDVEGNPVILAKMVYWNGQLVGMDSGGGLYLSNARYVEEIITSVWENISSIEFLYNNGIEDITDMAVDIFVDGEKLYVVGERGLYRLNKDLSPVTMNDMVMDLNLNPYVALSFSVDNGFLFKSNANNLYLFTYEEEIIDGTLAVQRIYNALLG